MSNIWIVIGWGAAVVCLVGAIYLRRKEDSHRRRMRELMGDHDG